MVVIETVVELQNSMQKEFEYYAEWFAQGAKLDKILQAKKNQQARVKMLLDIFQSINRSVDLLVDFQTKLQCCLLWHGVSASEVNYFVKSSLQVIMADVKEAMAQGLVQVPEKIQPLIDKAESESRWIAHLEKEIDKAEQKVRDPEPGPVRLATAPMLGIEALKNLTKKQKS